MSTILALVFGVRSLYAAFLGVASAALAILLAFPVPMESVAPAVVRWVPILVEVLLIVGGGLLLSEVLRQAGGQAVLADWVRGRAGQGVGAVLLVVHGITPFAESLTGFGIGVTIGIPLLAHFGLPARKVAVIGLLGLCAVPWGSMGPGTLIAATMSGVPFHDLGVASAVLSIVPFVVTGVAAAWLASSREGRAAAIVQGTLSGIVLTVAVLAANILFGTAPAGALGALAVIALHLVRGSRRGAATVLSGPGRRSLWSYAVLLGGVLVAGAIVRIAGLSENWRYVASPALWLFVAAVWFARGLPAREVSQRAWSSWTKVASVTGLFIVLGILMAVSGMAAFLAQTLAQTGSLYLVAAPFVGAMGGFVTGSNSGANAMFATTQAAIARSLGVDVLGFIAVHNVCAAFLLMGSPGKIEMAVQLSPADAAGHRRWIQTTVLLVSFVVVAALAAVNTQLAGSMAALLNVFSG
ncbi:L-lactate permease [Ottowia sp.]|uniref:L-lactate permease n=1 Tax=Ottowia sp. TaxID=1898956 RepID=UPI0039E5D7D4